MPGVRRKRGGCHGDGDRDADVRVRAASGACAMVRGIFKNKFVGRLSIGAGLWAAGAGWRATAQRMEFRAVLMDGVWGLREHIEKKLEGRAVTPTLYAAAHARPPPGEGSLNPLLRAEDSTQDRVYVRGEKSIVGWY